MRNSSQLWTISNAPAEPVTWRSAASTAAVEGDAKTSPHTAAVSMPAPTNPACAGSCPAPPPAPRCPPRWHACRCHQEGRGNPPWGAEV